MAKVKTTRIIGVVLIAITLFIVIGYISIQKKEKAVIADAIEAVPINAAYIFEVKNIVNLNQKLNTESIIWQELTKFDQLKTFKNQLSELDSIIAKSDFFQKFLKNRKVLISSHLIGTNETVFLFSIKLDNKKEQKEIISELFNLTQNNDTIKVSKEYNGSNLYTLSGNNVVFFCSIIENVLILSRSELIIENAIRQKSSNNPISLDIGFSQIAQTLTKNTNHIFVNYSNFGQSYSRYFSPVFAKKLKNLQNFANWAAFDINYKQDYFSLTGYSYAASSPDFYLQIFNNIEPQKLKLTYIIPSKTAEFTFFGFDDVAKFYSNYEKFVNSKNLAGTYKEITEKFNSDYKVDIQSVVLQLINNSIAFVNVNFNNSIDEVAHFTIIETNNAENFKTFLNSITEKHKTANNLETSFQLDFEIDNNTKHTIYKLPIGNFVKILFGELSYLTDQEYYFFLDNYIIFTNSADNAKLFINDVYRKKTLNYDEDFKKFLNNIPDKSNILYYSNSYFNSFRHISGIDEKYQDIYKKNLFFFNKIQHFCIQFSYEKQNLFQTHINIKYNQELTTKGLSAWETELKNNVATKPFFFINHYTYEKEIFLQDKDNIIYLLDKNGSVLWKKQLTEQIVGDVNMVDLYNNSKYQLIFSTANHIIAIDRNGELIENFPVELPQSTKIGLSIADYEGNNKYRIFVPCTDNTIYLFDNAGKEVEGWIKPKTESEITSKVEFFSYNGKDYIVFADKTKPYIMNRKGEIRVNISTSFPVPNNAVFYFQKEVGDRKAGFITTDASGKVLFINLNGTVETIPSVSVSNNHQFVAEDLNNDDLLDYIISDDKTIFVFNSNGEKLFSYTFKNTISNRPIILNFSNDNKKIGVVIPAENNVYLINTDGTITNNFPVQGNSIFSVGLLNSNKDFSLIVGNNNFLCNYLVL
ncbi:MAG: hypothetical protein JXL97_13285 [Bacteroidales bacterium]|nr:hypothetical protein [Bacteroidales bacterium]